MNTRLYQLTHKKTGAVRLVAAENQAQAYRHVSRDDYTIDTPTPLQIAALVTETGVKVERASDAA